MLYGRKCKSSLNGAQFQGKIPVLGKEAPYIGNVTFHLTVKQNSWPFKSSFINTCQKKLYGTLHCITPKSIFLKIFSLFLLFSARSVGRQNKDFVVVKQSTCRQMNSSV